jgi:glucan-binding YG repeat protein
MWTSNDGADFADAGSAQTSFIMPANNVTVTATYKDAQEAAADIISFTIRGAAGVISGTNIRVTVPAGTDVTALAPTIIVSEGASVSPASGVARDFTAPVTYTVTAENGGAKTYTVTVAFANDDPGISGWVEDSGAWYFYESGAAQTGWLYWERNWYLLDGADGHMLTGWEYVGGYWYYLAGSGKMKVGWLYDASYEAWFYLKGNGAMAAAEWVRDSGSWYYLIGNGEMATDAWVRNNGAWYYLKENGAMAADVWIWYKRNWYYLRPSGTMPENKWLRYNGNMYYLKADGRRAASETLRIGVRTYRFDSAGRRIASAAVRSVAAR